MLQTGKTRYRHATIAADIVAICAALLVARTALEGGLRSLWWGAQAPTELAPAAFAGQLSCLLLLWFVVTNRNELYSVSQTETLKRELGTAARCWLKAMGTATLASLVLWGSLAFDVLVSLALGGALLYLVRWGRREFASRNRSREFSYTILVGNGEHSRAIARWLDGNPFHSTKILGWLAFENQESGCAEAGEQLGKIEDLPRVLARDSVCSVILCPPASATNAEIQRVLDLCDEAGIPCHFVPGIELPRHLHLSLGCAGGLPGVEFLPEPSSSLRLAVKRALDVVVATVGLMLLSPVLILLAALIKLQDGGPVFYRQRRVGRRNEHFWCLKFRTMTVDAEARKVALQGMNEQDGPVFKIRQDPRVTRFGRFLRKYSLDELPQLFNVLAGHMSMVGPRPPTPDEVVRYEWWQRRRVSIRPGITCIWQIWGRNKVTFKRWVEMDLFYIDNWSLWMDLKLMVHTVAVVVRGTGM